MANVIEGGVMNILKTYLICILLVLSGCSTLSAGLLQTYGCSKLSEEEYNCSGSSIPQEVLTSPSCNWVNGYVSGGRYISGYYRCRAGITYFSSGATSSSVHISASSTSGSIYKSSGSSCYSVRSYYRKDGTHVRGHTRCR